MRAVVIVDIHSDVASFRVRVSCCLLSVCTGIVGWPHHVLVFALSRFGVCCREDGDTRAGHNFAAMVEMLWMVASAGLLSAAEWIRAILAQALTFELA